MGNIALQEYKYKFPTCNILSKMYEIFAFPQIKTTGLAGGMHHAFKAMMPAARHGQIGRAHV